MICPQAIFRGSFTCAHYILTPSRAAPHDFNVKCVTKRPGYLIGNRAPKCTSARSLGMVVEHPHGCVRFGWCQVLLAQHESQTMNSPYNLQGQRPADLRLNQAQVRARRQRPRTQGEQRLSRPERGRFRQDFESAFGAVLKDDENPTIRTEFIECLTLESSLRDFRQPQRAMIVDRHCEVF